VRNKLNYTNIVKEALELEANELLRTANSLDKNIDKAIELIDSLKGKLIITGVGKSGLVGAKAGAAGTTALFFGVILSTTEALFCAV